MDDSIAAQTETVRAQNAELETRIAALSELVHQVRRKRALEADIAELERELPKPVPFPWKPRPSGASIERGHPS